jgi:predicted signal transduction protein with EAL and GGDEF domain
MVARLGGDEFAVVHEAVASRDQAAGIADRLLARVREPFSVDGNTLNVDASVGVVVPRPEDTVEALMRQVDMALYRAKEEGRGTFAFFEPEMDKRLQARRTLHDDLRRAIANNEFDLFYQPLLNTRSGGIVGFEALMRWRHPERGMVSPGEFIPVAEETGLIVPMGSWALRRACRDAVRWPGVKVAVNLSVMQFRDDKLPAVIRQALAESRLSPELLELEITESVLVGDKPRVLAMLRDLRQLKVQVALDDFGTGYSSLAYFREFPFDKVKVDRMFVEGIGERRDCDAVISAVMGIASDLQMTTLAEGVETAVQLQRLRDRGCAEVQGFLFSPPVPVEKVPALIERFGIHKEPIRHVSYATRSAARGA